MSNFRPTSTKDRAHENARPNIARKPVAPKEPVVSRHPAVPDIKLGVKTFKNNCGGGK